MDVHQRISMQGLSRRAGYEMFVGTQQITKQNHTNNGLLTICKKGMATYLTYRKHCTDYCLPVSYSLHNDKPLVLVKVHLKSNHNIAQKERSIAPLLKHITSHMAHALWGGDWNAPPEFVQRVLGKATFSQVWADLSAPSCT